jgi:hypothetical protein
MALELTDLLTEGGLRHVKALCRTTEMELFSHGEKRSQMTEFHGEHLPDE